MPKNVTALKSSRICYYTITITPYQSYVNNLKSTGQRDALVDYLLNVKHTFKVCLPLVFTTIDEGIKMAFSVVTNVDWEKVSDHVMVEVNKIEFDNETYGCVFETITVPDEIANDSSDQDTQSEPECDCGCKKHTQNEINYDFKEV
jgi:hypothetical protein